MKKLISLGLALLLTLSLLTACGTGAGGNTSGSGNTSGGGNTPSSGSATSPPADNGAKDGNAGGGSSKAVHDVIPASALISLEEASAIMGLELKADENKPITTAFIDAARYSLDGTSLKVELKQEALYDEETSITKLTKGWAYHIESELKRITKQSEEEHEEYIMTVVPGIGDAAFLSESTVMDHWALFVFYGEYIIVVGVSPSIFGDPATADEAAWFKEKAMEAGKLAADHLKAIIG